MVQNHLSIDFRHTIRGTDSYEFGYNVERSIEVATSIVLQYYDGKKSLPAWYVKESKRLYADSITGYWNVDGFTLTFVAGGDPIADIEARVSALESASVQQAGDISELEGTVSGIESSIEEINTTLSVQSSDIASLKTRTTAVENKASTNEANISSLAARMSTAEGRIQANASDIASLKTRTTAVENKASTNESNISSLATRITSVEAKIPVIVSYINGTVSYRTASGNSVDFTNGYSAYLQKALVTITAEQSGSGEPSPTNIRPISGVSSVTVTRTDETGANSQSVTVPLVDSSSNPLTVYGGTLEVTAGKLTVTHAFLEFNGSESWIGNMWNSVTFYCNNNRAIRTKVISSTAGIYGISNLYTWRPFEGSYNGIQGLYRIRDNDSVPYAFAIKGSDGVVCLKDTRFTNVDGLKAELTLHPLQVAYEIAPVTYQLTPAQITLLDGYNFIVSSGDNITILYPSTNNLVL